MPIEGSAGTLDIENATLRSNAIAVLANLVTGNDRVRESGAPALEVYGDPSNGGNEARLEMVSNTATVSSKAFTRLTSNAGVLSVKTGTDASDNGTITFGGFANERMRIGSDGKVGIGTNGPAEKLDVQGSALITGSTYGIKSTGTLGSDKSEGWYRLLIGGIRSGASSIRTECKLQLQASGLHQSLTFDFNHMISLSQTSGNSFNLLGNDHYISRVGITKLRLADAGSNQFALDMYIDHDVVPVERDWTITLYTEGGSLISEATTFLEKITATPSASIELDTDTSIFGIVGSTTSKTLIMHENGNVGIGTTNPDRKLHVKYDTGSWDNTTGAAVIIEDPGSIGAGITLKPTGSGVTNGTNGWALYAGSTSGSVGDGNIGFWAHGTNKAPFRVHRNGNIILLDSPSTGEVIVGDTSTTYDPANMNTSVTSTPTNPILHVNGSIQLKSDNDAIVIGNNAATFLKDEELHFGWGGGWYMTDGTHLRVVNNKKIYSTGAARFGLQLLLDAYGDENSTNCLFIGTNTASQNLRIGCNSTDNYCWIQSHQGKPLRLNPTGNEVQYGTGNTVLSDDRIKANEVYIENATDTLLKLKPQIYDKKLIWNISKLGETSNTSIVREGGLITQDVWYDTPELRHLVHLGEGAEPGDDKPYTDNDPTNDPDYSSWGDNVSLLDYNGLIPYLIKSNQELHARIQALENAS